MAIEDTFNGAKVAYTFFFAYLNTVAQEIGMDQALALLTKMAEAMGARQGKMIKEQAGVQECDAKAADLQIMSNRLTAAMAQLGPRTLVTSC